jgi:homoserine dehydrogenase
VGLTANAPVRLILVDVGGGRTMAIVVACAEPSTLALFDAQVAASMPVIESLELHPPTP